MSKIITMGLFSFSALLIMSGIFIQTKATLLQKGQQSILFNKFIAIITKYSGFTILAYLVYNCPMHSLIPYLSIFIATYFVSFLLYLLARRASLR